jgi:hypothetical protein
MALDSKLKEDPQLFEQATKKQVALLSNDAKAYY